MIEENRWSRLPGLDSLRRPDAFIRAAEVLAALPERDRYDRGELLVPELLLTSSGRLQEYYAPHNEIPSRQAQVVIAGLTPGWRQMEISLRTMRRALLEGRDAREACLLAKREARFAGSMRRDLLGMLERLGLPSRLAEWEASRQGGNQPGRRSHASPQPGRRSDASPRPDPAAVGCEHASTVPDPAAPAANRQGPSGEAQDLLHHRLMHTTSVLPCPVFMDGANYSGHAPPLGRSPILLSIMSDHMREELGCLHRPLIIPLGRAVEHALRSLAADGWVSEDAVLWGFPHPSGANGSRHAQFEAALPGMMEVLQRFKPDFTRPPLRESGSISPDT